MKNNKQSYRLLIYTLDEMKKKNCFEFTWRKSINNDPTLSIRNTSNHTDLQLYFDDSELLATQVQKLFSLYKSRPRFGPESSEDCIRIASLLRPVEDLMPSESFLSIKNQLPIRINQESVSNQIDSSLKASNHDTGQIMTLKVGDKADTNFAKAVEKFEDNERDLDNLSKSSQNHATSKATKSASYATQTKPIGLDQAIIYCKSKYETFNLDHYLHLP